jgi:hypothetical protein
VACGSGGDVEYLVCDGASVSWCAEWGVGSVGVMQDTVCFAYMYASCIYAECSSRDLTLQTTLHDEPLPLPLHFSSVTVDSTRHTSNNLTDPLVLFSSLHRLDR